MCGLGGGGRWLPAFLGQGETVKERDFVGKNSTSENHHSLSWLLASGLFRRGGNRIARFLPSLFFKNLLRAVFAPLEISLPPLSAPARIFRRVSKLRECFAFAGRGGETEEEVFIRLFLTVPLPPFFCTYLLPIVKCRPRRAVFVKKLPPLTHPRRRSEASFYLALSHPPSPRSISLALTRPGESRAISRRAASEGRRWDWLCLSKPLGGKKEEEGGMRAAGGRGGRNNKDERAAAKKGKRGR